ncbi:MAG: prepilin, partial [Meiothermus sp.]|nr:prepilin [Meiothermus sp.]
IALAVLAVGFTALLYRQVGNLKASTQSKLNTQVKAAANRVLEQKLAEVLVVQMDDTSATPAGSSNTISSSSFVDESSATVFNRSGVKQSFFFVDYYWNCPEAQTPPTGSGVRSSFRSVTCAGTESVDGISVSWNIRAQSGFTGEGVLDVVVTASTPGGGRLTLGSRVSCYDIYPSPSANAPKPCPTPGNGRS